MLTPVRPSIEAAKAAATAKRVIRKNAGTVPAIVMKEPLAHPTVAAVKAIQEEVLAAHRGLAAVRDQALLESAVAAPQATMMGEPLITDPGDVAAAYLFYLCRNHPFIDGNKRTALATCLVVLSENGLLPDEELDTNAWESLTLAVAASELDRAQTAARLHKLPKKHT